MHTCTLTLTRTRNLPDPHTDARKRESLYARKRESLCPLLRLDRVAQAEVLQRAEHLVHVRRSYAAPLGRCAALFFSFVVPVVSVLKRRHVGNE
jgi:hypothetical protein